MAERKSITAEDVAQYAEWKGIAGDFSQILQLGWRDGTPPRMRKFAIDVTISYNQFSGELTDGSGTEDIRRSTIEQLVVRVYECIAGNLNAISHYQNSLDDAVEKANRVLCESVHKEEE